jgi:hypothetical protein
MRNLTVLITFGNIYVYKKQDIIKQEKQKCKKQRTKKLDS